jgi:small conductance mechanosensitive channel
MGPHRQSPALSAGSKPEPSPSLTRRVEGLMIVDVSAPECAADNGSLCQWMWENTGADLIARNADTVLSGVLHIGFIVVVAVIVRFLIFRAINRVTRLTASGGTPTALRPLRDQARRAFGAGLAKERRAQRARSIGSLLKSISSFAIVSISAVLVLAELGFDVAPILASAGIAGVALAFGAQNLVKDFLAGIFMTLEDQYSVGDTVDLGPATGTVTEVGLRTTTVRAGDGTIWYVRNGEVLRVGNSSQGEAVVTINLPMPYDADVGKAGAIALENATAVCQRDDFAEAIIEPPKLLGIVDVGPGMVTIGLVTTVRTGVKDDYTRAVRAAVRTAFDDALAADSKWDFRPPVIVPPAEKA